MSSSFQFPSGLNNWVGNDKPARQDFVSDNEILDQGAMWKTAYDENGTVAAAGGIEAFALHKQGYDPTGAIAAGGGIGAAIESAVNANEGFARYAHNKAGEVHVLLGSGGNIKFVATASFQRGDSFLVNGEACTARTISGEALHGDFFVAGAVVTCHREGSTLNFKTGGAGLNYKVIAVATQEGLPSSADENTIAVVTAKPLGIHSFSVEQPASPSEGDVWFSTAAVSPAPFSLLRERKLMIYPRECRQFEGGSWVVRAARIFQNEEWKPWTYWLYNCGDSCTAQSGGWIQGAAGQTNSMTLTSASIEMQTSGMFSISSGIVQARTARLVDLTGIDTVWFRCNAQGSAIAGVSTKPDFWQVSDMSAYTAVPQGGSGAVVGVDVRTLSGPYYIGLALSTYESYNPTRTASLHEVWF